MVKQRTKKISENAMNRYIKNRLVLTLIALNIFCQSVDATNKYGHFIDFDQAMICNKRDIPLYQKALQNDSETINFFDFARNQYNAYIVEGKNYSETPKIPKIIHQIWVGPNTPPKHFRKWQKTLLKLHPGWEYKLWTDKEVADLTLINQRYYDEETNYGAKADILRLELLNQFGGVYIDIDFEGLKPLDPLHHLCDFYTGFFHIIYLRNSPRINNGIIASSRNHPFIQILINELGKNRNKQTDLNDWYGILARNGPDFVTKTIHTYLPQVKGANVILPANYFYPWSGSPKNLELCLTPETLAIHYFASSWDPHVHELPHLENIK